LFVRSANAGQHGGEGSEIVLEIDGSATDAAHITVLNDGCIPPEMMPRLFTPFRRERDHSSGGLGLGLFIVHEIVRSHGGTINVESSDEKGTAFRIQLPRHIGGLLPTVRL
jgi:signal transduction histidine kinase